MDASTVSGEVVIKLKETDGSMCKEPRKAMVEFPESGSSQIPEGFDESTLDEETLKVLSLYREGKLTREYAREMLDLIGYSEAEIEELLETEPSNGGVTE